MNAQELAEKFVKRISDWGLEWEVLWVMFQRLIDEGISPELLNNALEEGLSEWDV